MTPDKDYEQLVSDDIVIYKPGRRGSDPEIFGVKEVLKKWVRCTASEITDAHQVDLAASSSLFSASARGVHWR